MSEETIKAEILRLEQQRRQALVDGDVAALGQLMSEDLVHVHGNGKRDDKAGYLKGVQDKYRFYRIDRGEMDIRVYDGCVVTCGPLSQTVSIDAGASRKEVAAVATQVWISTGQGWKQSTCHMSILPVS